MEPEVLVDDAGAVRFVTLNRPDVLNALTDGMRSAIAATVREFDRLDHLRVLVLTGAGRGFCSGADLSPRDAATPQEPKRPTPRFWWHLPFEETNKPTICALNGAAAGGGIGLALSCDIIVASSSARLHPAFVGLGLSPDNGVSQKIVTRIGYPQALRFFLAGQPVEAARAFEIGFVDEVVAPDQLQEHVREMAAQFADRPPVSVGLTKRLLKEALTHDRATSLVLEEAAIALARETEDAKEGALAFRERRAPVWKGY